MAPDMSTPSTLPLTSPVAVTALPLAFLALTLKE